MKLLLLLLLLFILLLLLLLKLLIFIINNYNIYYLFIIEIIQILLFRITVWWSIRIIIDKNIKFHHPVKELVWTFQDMSELYASTVVYIIYYITIDRK